MSWLLLSALLLPGGGLWARLTETEYKSVGRVNAKLCSDSASEAPCVWTREQPRSNAKVLWKMWKFSPVEVVSYRGSWVRVRDFEGDEGWLEGDDLSDVRTVCVSFKEGRIRAGPSTKAKIVWILDRGYPLRVFRTQQDWYEVSDLEDVSGWIHASAVWP